MADVDCCAQQLKGGKTYLFPAAYPARPRSEPASRRRLRVRCYDRRVIVDAHTHIFPPSVIANRERLLSDEPAFRALYDSPKATIAQAGDLLDSMAGAGIDVSIAMGFAWRDPALCRAHNDYLIEAGRKSAGRILPFCNLPLAAGNAAIEAEMHRCAAQGVRGFGELRPDNLDFDVAGPDGDGLAQTARALDSALLFHVSEPAGHLYPGKHGLAMERFAGFVRRHPDVRVIGAHWGGGLPFYARMPEVRAAFEGGNLLVDTAATSLLYDDAIYQSVATLTGAGSIVFGSDYPLLTQKRSRRRIEESGLDAEAVQAVLGGNIAKWLRPA